MCKWERHVERWSYREEKWRRWRTFKYLGSTVQNKDVSLLIQEASSASWIRGEASSKTNYHVKFPWDKWRDDWPWRPLKGKTQKERCLSTQEQCATVFAPFHNNTLCLGNNESMSPFIHRPWAVQSFNPAPGEPVHASWISKDI